MAKRKTDVQQFRARIHGRVQGVGFRYFVQREALRLGLKGLVRNLATGQVEVVAQGSPETLNELLEKLYEGPALAWVQRVVVDWQEPDKSLLGFQVQSSTW